MIGYIKGTVTNIAIDWCFVETNGIGYRIFISNNTRNKLIKEAEVKLITYLNVREDAMQLYGFCKESEYDLFLKLIAVSGIGPRVAMGILSAISPEDLCSAIRFKKTTALTKLPGIGKKTAERIILELADKVGSAEDEFIDEINITTENNDVMGEAIEALVALGYGQNEIMPILRKIKSFDKVEIVIKQVLKEVAGGNNGR